MKTLKSILVALSILAVSGIQAQTADEIVEKHVKAIGGREKLNGVKSLKMTGKFTVQGTELPTVVYFKRQNSIRHEMTLQNLTIIEAYDSKTNTGWYVQPMEGDKNAQKMEQEQVTEFAEEAEDLIGPLTNYKEKGQTVELIGKEDLEGTEVYKIMLTKKNKNVSYFFIDASTYMILKEASKMKFQDKEIEAESYYSNYKTFDGITLATTQEDKQGGQLVTQTHMDKVEVNLPVDDALFVMPPRVEVKDAPKTEEKKDEKKSGGK
jgi:hypothetical protein